MLSIGLSGFAQSEKSAAEELAKTVSNRVRQAPSGTMYGIEKETKNEVVVSTPIGKFQIEKKNGEYSFMGLSARIESRKGNTYVVNSSIGRFKVDTKKCTITKI